MRGRTKTDWWGLCLEAPDPQALADFYAAVLGWPVVKQDEHGAAIQAGETNSFISFQEAAEYVRPTWPAEPGKQRRSCWESAVASTWCRPTIWRWVPR